MRDRMLTRGEEARLLKAAQRALLEALKSETEALQRSREVARQECEALRGAIEGERVCRHWSTRRAFQSSDRFADHAQYTTTPAGEYWCLTHIEGGDGQPILARLAAVADGTGAAVAGVPRRRHAARCRHPRSRPHRRAPRLG